MENKERGLLKKNHKKENEFMKSEIVRLIILLEQIF
jgi:hypothetical protein